MRALAPAVTKEDQLGVQSSRPLQQIAVRFEDLVVQFPEFTLGPITCALSRGQIFTLVGPNGSGKTTLIKALLGLVPLSEGQVSVNDIASRGRPAEVLREVGYVPDDTNETIPELTAWELWELHAMVHARVRGDVTEMLDRAAEIAETLDFDPPTAPIEGYSYGMRKKAQLVAGLLHDPGIIVLDEPRNGLDPIAMARLDGLVVSARDHGKLVILATHDLHFAQRMATVVCILDQGRAVTIDDPSRLLHPGEDLVQAFMRIVGAARRGR